MVGQLVDSVLDEHGEGFLLHLFPGKENMEFQDVAVVGIGNVQFYDQVLFLEALAKLGMTSDKFRFLLGYPPQIDLVNQLRRRVVVTSPVSSLELFHQPFNGGKPESGADGHRSRQLAGIGLKDMDFRNIGNNPILECYIDSTHGDSDVVTV